MSAFTNTRYVWLIKNFQQQLGIANNSGACTNANAINCSKMIESPAFTNSGATGNDVNKWKAWVEANRIADPSVAYSSTNGQDFFLTIRVRNQVLKTSSNGIYCRVEIMSREKKCVFTVVSQTTARGIYSNLTTFQLHRVCNISELERQNPDLYNGGNLTMVLCLGPIRTLQDDSATEQLVRMQLVSINRDKALLEPLKSMFDQGILADVIVRTREKDYRCHKIILAAASPVFRAMFETEMKESANNVVDFRNVFDAKTVGNFIYYAYTKQVPSDLGEASLPLLAAADYFQLDILKRLCVQVICKIISVKNVADILQVSEKYNIEPLQKTAIRYIVEHSKEVVASPGWKSIPPETTKYLLSSFLLAVSDKKT